MKNGIRILGVDDGPFSKTGSRRVLVVGAVWPDVAVDIFDRAGECSAADGDDAIDGGFSGVDRGGHCAEGDDDRVGADAGTRGGGAFQFEGIGGVQRVAVPVCAVHGEPVVWVFVA